jgi:hypothetical protein
MVEKHLFGGVFVFILLATMKMFKKKSRENSRMNLDVLTVQLQQLFMTTFHLTHPLSHSGPYIHKYFSR